MTMIDEKAVEAAQKATTTRIDLVSGYYLFQHKPTDMTCSIHAPDGLHIGNLLANEAGDFAAEITSLRAGLAIAKPVAEPVAWVQREVLDELRRHKDATATVASGLLKKPFGNPVALYALSAPASKDGG